jgi:hypothetical protein
VAVRVGRFRSGKGKGKRKASMHDWNSEHVALTGELSFDDEDILPIRCFSMEASVDRKVFVLQGEYLVSLHIGKD